MLVLLAAHSVAVCADDPVCDIDSLHESVPAFSRHESRDFWFDVQGVGLSGDGQVLIEGVVSRRTSLVSPAEHPCSAPLQRLRSGSPVSRGSLRGLVPWTA